MKNRKIPERKKRYSWLVLLTVLAWGLVGAMIVWVDPENVRDLLLPGSYLMFVVPLCLAVFLLLTIVFLSAKRAWWWTMGLVVFIYLRVYGLGTLLNGVLIVGILVCGELYVRMDKMGYTLRHASLNKKA